MSAETLRQVAALMRERAEAATPGPWHPVQSDYTFNPSIGTVNAEGAEHLRSDQWIAEAGPDGEGGMENAEHIASWHPAVALAVAATLDQHADIHNTYDCVHEPCAAEEAARAYLGGAS